MEGTMESLFRLHLFTKFRPRYGSLEQQPSSIDRNYSSISRAFLFICLRTLIATSHGGFTSRAVRRLCLVSLVQLLHAL